MSSGAGILQTMMQRLLAAKQQQSGVQMGNHLMLPSIDDETRKVQIPDSPWSVEYFIPNDEPSANNKRPVRNTF